MKKSIRLFLLLFVLIFTLSACDYLNPEVRGKDRDKPLELAEEHFDENQVKTETDEDTEIETDVEESAESIAEPEDEREPEKAKAKKEFSLGKRTSNVYESEFIGMGYRLDAGWKFYSDQKIRELNRIALNYVDEEYESMLRNANVVYDMFATDSNEMNSININLEKADKSMLFTLDVRKNYQLVAPVLVDSYQNMGYQNVRWNIVGITVDGRTMDAIKVSASINGVNMYQTMFQRKCNGYMANVVMTAYYTDSTLQMIDNIYWLD